MRLYGSGRTRFRQQHEAGEREIAAESVEFRLAAWGLIVELAGEIRRVVGARVSRVSISRVVD